MPLECSFQGLNPTDRWWYMKNEKIYSTATVNPPIKQNLLRTISCSCKRECKTAAYTCICNKHGLKWTLCEFCEIVGSDSVDKNDDVKFLEKKLNLAIKCKKMLRWILILFKLCKKIDTNKTWLFFKKTIDYILKLIKQYILAEPVTSVYYV